MFSNELSPTRHDLEAKVPRLSYCDSTFRKYRRREGFKHAAGREGCYRMGYSSFFFFVPFIPFTLANFL